MAIAIDASTPTLATNATAGTTLASNSFSPPAGSLILIALVNWDNTTAFSGVTDSLGSHLTWTKISGNPDAGYGVVIELWYAYTASAPGSMTVTATAGASLSIGSFVIRPVVLTGTATSLSGAATPVLVNLTSTVFTGSITTTVTGSQVFAPILNSSGVAVTTAGGQTITINGTSSLDSHTGSYIQTTTAPSGAPGSVTISDTAPNTTHQIGILAEVLAAGGAATPTNLFFPFC